MRKARGLLVLVGVLGVTGVALATPPPYSNSRYNRASSEYDYAPVTHVEPIVRQVRIETPRRECYDDTRYVESPNPNVGAWQPAQVLSSCRLRIGSKNSSRPRSARPEFTGRRSRFCNVDSTRPANPAFRRTTLRSRSSSPSWAADAGPDNTTPAAITTAARHRDAFTLR